MHMLLDPIHTNMLNIFKSGLTKQLEKLVVLNAHILQLNKVKTCLNDVCKARWFGIVFSK